MSAEASQVVPPTSSSTCSTVDDGVDEPEVIISGENVDGAGLMERGRGAATLFFVIGVWMTGICSPMIALGLWLYGGSRGRTMVAGLVAVTVYPYLTPAIPHDGRGSWMAFRRAIAEWEQHWHKSCGRIYEVEGPDAWDKSPPTVLCYHPHGVFTQGYMLNGSLRRELPMIVGLLSSALFHAPLFRLVFGKWSGACAPASKKHFLEQMKQGRTFGIIPGGFQEAALTELGVDRVWMQQRKGFVKYALEYGYRLRPVFTFGESDTYWNIQGAWNFRLWITSKNTPSVLPIGVWWCPLLPRRVRLMTVFGPPLALPKLPNPSREDVDKWHAIYVENLVALYDRHKGRYASNPEGELEVW